jgi:hypothetical protein
MGGGGGSGAGREREGEAGGGRERAPLALKFGVSVRQLALLEGQLQLDTSALADLMHRFELATQRRETRVVQVHH